MKTVDDYETVFRLEKVDGEWTCKEGIMVNDKFISRYTNVDIVLPGAISNIDIQGTITFPHIDLRPQKTTLTIYYDNGLPFTAKSTINHSKSDTELRYTIEREDRGVKSSTDYVVPLHDVMAIVYKQGDKVWVDKLKPCASVKIDVVKV